MNCRSILLLSVVPVIVFVLALSLRISRGPFYLAENMDPSYMYLFNALRIKDHTTPMHYDNPGTTVQSLGGLIISARSFISGFTDDEARMDVLRNPERNLALFNMVISLLLSAVVLAAGLVTLTTTGSLAPSLALQWGVLVYPTVVSEFSKVAPEPILVIAVLFSAMAARTILFGKPATESNLERLSPVPLLHGASLGFAVATKLTAVPLLLTVWLWKPMKNQISVMAAAVVSFAFFTIPIIPLYPDFFLWIKALATHQGRYGTGTAGIPAAEVLARNCLNLLTNEPALTASVIVLLFLAAHARGRDHAFRRVFLVGIAVILLAVMITAKHPGSHYLVPTLVFCSVITAAAVDHVRRNGTRFHRRVLLALYLFATAWAIWKIPQLFVRAKQYRQDQAVVMAVVKELAPNPVRYYGSSSQEYALAFGQLFCRGFYGKELKSLYPDACFYNDGRYFFSRFDGEVIAADRLPRNGSGDVILVGRTRDDDFPPTETLVITPLFVKEKSAVYRLEGELQKPKL